jgi:hypothetical protein
MRIVFTMKMEPVISNADVSRNGLFIGLWTEAEVALGFIVACSLCLPKLIQVKGKKLRGAIRHASTPWSSATSKSRKSWLWDSSRDSSQQASRNSRQMRQFDGERPMYYEERTELQRLNQVGLKAMRDRHDIYRIPSTAGNSVHSTNGYLESYYSRSVGLEQASLEEGHVQTATTTRPVVSRTISMRTQEVPVCLDSMDMIEEDWEDERRMLQQFELECNRALNCGRPGSFAI